MVLVVIVLPAEIIGGSVVVFSHLIPLELSFSDPKLAKRSRLIQEQNHDKAPNQRVREYEQASYSQNLLFSSSCEPTE